MTDMMDLVGLGIGLAIVSKVIDSSEHKEKKKKKEPKPFKW